MNNDVFEKSSAKIKVALGYSEKNRCIMATITNIVKGNEIKGRPITDWKLIQKVLQDLGERENKKLSELVESGIVSFSNIKITKDGVIIINDDGKYRRLFYDVKLGDFKTERLTRAERVSLGLLHSSDSHEEKEENNSKENMENTIDITDIYEVAKEIQRLNPKAEIRMEDWHHTGRIQTGFYSSLPLEHLVLPNGFRYRDERTINVSDNKGYIYGYNIYPLTYANENDLIPKGVFDKNAKSPNATKEEKKDDTMSSSTKDNNEEPIRVIGYISPPLKETTDIIKKPTEVIIDKTKESNKETENKKNENKKTITKSAKGIKFRKIAVKTVAVLAAGYVLIGGVRSLFANKDNTKAVSNPTRTEEKNGSNINTPDRSSNNNQSRASSNEYINKSGYVYGSNVEYDDMQTQLNVIDNAAINNQGFEFENLVVNNDYDAIYAINNLRNSAIKGNYDMYLAMDTLIKYVFNDDRYINGNFIESYNSLNPYAKYIVIRISQGMLQNCRDNNILKSITGYNKTDLIEKYDDLGSSLYMTLMQNQKTR